MYVKKYGQKEICSDVLARSLVESYLMQERTVALDET
jgi:hypothetical protein